MYVSISEFNFILFMYLCDRSPFVDIRLLMFVLVGPLSDSCLLFSVACYFLSLFCSLSMVTFKTLHKVMLSDSQIQFCVYVQILLMVTLLTSTHTHTHPHTHTHTHRSMGRLKMFPPLPLTPYLWVGQSTRQAVVTITTTTVPQDSLRGHALQRLPAPLKPHSLS